MTVLQRKLLSYLLIIATALVPVIGFGPDVAEASVLTYVSEAAGAGVVGAATPVYGTISSGNSDYLNEKNQGYMVMSSASNGTSQETSFWADFTLNSAGTYIMSLEIDTTAMTSVSNSTQKIYLYNYTTSAYDEVKSSTIGTSDTDVVYLNETNSTISKYISVSNTIRVKIAVTNSSSISTSFDYVNLIYRYQPQVSNRAASTYNVTNATIEYGTVSSNNATYMQNLDGYYFGVSSSSNKVAWNSLVTMNQSRGEIKTLVVSYNGTYSDACNNTWMSLWNYQTGNWEVVYNFVSDTTARNVKWVTSDPNYINKFVSEFNDIKVRLYNSASAAFTRSSDYLNVTVYYDTASTSVKGYSPDTLALDYGTISSGSVENLAAYDNNYVVINSDAYNRIAWKGTTTIDVDRQYVKSLTVVARVKYSGATNNQHFSLWNYSTGNWSVFREQVTSTANESLVVTITDPEEIYRYISSLGQIQARLYNSASAAFTRSTDELNFIVEYGTVGTFEFAHLSDVHELIGSANFLAIASELNNYVHPVFTVVTGDITDHGTPAQYQQYLADKPAINGTVYTTTGNHDVRWWNSNGKNDWIDRIGPLYYSYNYGGVHFVVMDSTVSLELDEDFGKVQLDWLMSDLSAISTDMPVVIFAHHPFKIADNVTGKAEIIDLLKSYNVVAYISGHQHYYGYTIENGILWEYITYIKDNNLQEFTSVKVTPNKLYVYQRKASDHSSTLWLTAPMVNKRKASLTITSATAQVNGNVDVGVTIDKAPDGVSTVQARIDNYGPYTTLTQTGTNTWTGTIDASLYSPAIPYGKHFIGVNMTDTVGKVWKEYKEYEWSGGDVETRWVFQTGDLIQSSPTYFNGVVYAGSEDGKVYAINEADGLLRWSYTTGDQIISKPAIYQRADGTNLVIVGSHDRSIYALNADTGALVWSYLTGGSVISDPLVDNGVVYFGAGDMYIYALNASDGTFRWSYLTQGLMRQRPIVVNGKLYVNVRDTYIWYALNTVDGSLYWRGNAATDESMFVCGDVRPLYTSAYNKLWAIDAQNTKAAVLDPATGNVAWTSTAVGISSRGPSTDGSRVFYCAGNGRQVYAYNASDNTQAWYTDLRAGGSDSDYQPFQIDSALIYDSGIIYHVAERGRITGIDAVTGAIRFIYDAVGYPERVLWSTPEVYNKNIYVGGLDGKIYAVRYNGI